MPFHYFGIEKPANNASMTTVFCFLATFSAFGDTPIEAELKVGKQIFEKHKGIDRTEKDARVVIGQWFDGDRTKVVEEAVFVTPGLLSRWLGFQLASGRSPEEVNASWLNCSSQFSNRSVVIIRLARLSAVDMIDGDVDNSAKPAALDSINLQIHQVGKPWIPVSFRTVQDLQQRRPEEVLKDSWDQILAKFTAWPSKPTENELFPDIRWGRNRRVSLIAETPPFAPATKCELKIVEKDRIRVIPFDYPKS
jgi:hypothetical protein